MWRPCPEASKTTPWAGFKPAPYVTVAGMVVGKLVDCEEKDHQGRLPDVRTLILEITKNYGFPIIGSADFGHNAMFMPMPEGILAEIDSKQLSIELIETVVK